MVDQATFGEVWPNTESIRHITRPVLGRGPDCSTRPMTLRSLSHSKQALDVRVNQKKAEQDELAPLRDLATSYVDEMVRGPSFDHDDDEPDHPGMCLRAA